MYSYEIPTTPRLNECDNFYTRKHVWRAGRCVYCGAEEWLWTRPLTFEEYYRICAADVFGEFPNAFPPDVQMRLLNPRNWLGDLTPSGLYPVWTRGIWQR